MIAASRPRPAMTRKACRRSPTLEPSPTCSSRCASSGLSRSQPTSMCRLRPVMATSTARARSSVGTSRLRASRLPVPPGSSPIGTPEPTISCATARTVPSPPKAHTTSTFSASAVRVWPKPTSCSSVSMKSGSSHPSCSQTRAMTACTSSPTPSSLVGLSTTASRLRGGGGVSSTARKASRDGRLLAESPVRRDDSSSHSPAPTRTTATAMPAHSHHPSDTVWKVQHLRGRIAGEPGRRA